MLRWVKLYGTTDASGDLTATSDLPVKGILLSVEWIDGDLADGVDAVLTLVRDDDAADITLLTLTDANNDAVYALRYPVYDNTGAVINFLSVEHFLNGYLKLVVSDGGDTKSGGMIVYYEG
jgi:hypothetical protein